MQTIDYRLAAPRPIEMRFNDGDGDAIIDADFKFALPVIGACEIVKGVLGVDF